MTDVDVGIELWQSEWLMLLPEPILIRVRLSDKAGNCAQLLVPTQSCTIGHVILALESHFSYDTRLCEDYIHHYNVKGMDDKKEKKKTPLEPSFSKRLTPAQHAARSLIHFVFTSNKM